MPEVVVNGTRLHYQQHGSAGPDVVLLHAVTSNLAVWLFTSLVDTLAENYRVTLFDFRGHGASDRPPTGYTSADMAGDFAGLHRELGLRPAYLVGHSFGGVVGLHAAVLFPELVAGVILSDSFFPGLRHVEPNFGKANVWADLCETYAKVGVDLGPTVDFRRLFHATAELSPAGLKTLEELVGPFGKGWLRQLPRLAETTCGDDVLAEAGLSAERVAGVSRPVVALYDEFSPFHATGRWLAANVPGCVAEVIPAAKHLALVENPAGFADAVGRHLKRLTGKA